MPLVSNVCAVIPFYNERNTINEIIKRTLCFVDMIIAVNDGSDDGSENEIPVEPRVILITSPVNNGKGAALNLGFLKSTQMGFDLTVTLDADLQHPPEIIPLLLNLGNYDIVIGNRLNNKNQMPVQRKLSNSITSFLLSIKTNQKIVDSQCGFRVYKTKILLTILPRFTGFEAESEIIVNAARKNLKIGFIDIPTIYANEKSKMRPVQAILGFLKVMTI
jgi:glycosyltransferase involved in cell wall biosynthesis